MYVRYTNVGREHDVDHMSQASMRYSSVYNTRKKISDKIHTVNLQSDLSERHKCTGKSHYPRNDCN